MKIINREEFLKLPTNTLYCKFMKDDSFGTLFIKLNSINNNDWYYQALSDFDYYGNSTERYERINLMLTDQAEYPLKLDSSSRDGLYNLDDLFCIYSEEDIKEIIKLLHSLL